MRWDLKIGERVYVQCLHSIGLVNRISIHKIDVEVWFPETNTTRVFLWDEGLIPVDNILGQVLNEEIRQ